MSTADANSVTVRFDPTANSKQSDIIGPVTDKTAGVMTPGLLNRVISFVPVEIFVDEGAGSDSNPGTAAAPVKTFNKAWSLRPAFAPSATIHVAPGAYVADSDYESKSYPTVVIGSVDNLLGTLTSDGASDLLNYIAVGLTTVTGALRGTILRNLVTGERAFVATNVFAAGNTTFTLLSPTFNMTPGDTFVIEDPTAIFTAPTDTPPGFTDVDIKNVRFAWDGAPAIFGVFVFLHGFDTLDGVIFDTGSGFGAVFAAHGEHINLRFAVEAQAFSSDCGAWIKADDGTQGFLQISDNSSLVGSLMLDNTGVLGDTLSSIVLPYIDMQSPAQDDLLVVNFDSWLQLGSGHMSGVTVEVIASRGVLGHGDFGDGFPLTIENAPLSGIIASRFAQVQCGSIVGSTGNLNAGVEARHESQLSVNNFGGTTSVTGAAGDALIGSVVKAYSDLPYDENVTLGADDTAGTAANNTITGLSGLTNANAGDILVLDGFATPGNNGTFKILYVTSATAAVLAGPVGMITTPDANSGSASWTLFSATQFTLNWIGNG